MGNHVAHEESRDDLAVDSRWSTMGASVHPVLLQWLAPANIKSEVNSKGGHDQKCEKIEGISHYPRHLVEQCIVERHKCSLDGP